MTALAHAEISRARRNGAVYGGRNLLAVPAIQTLAASAALRDLVEPVLGSGAIPVRALFFDKNPDANWPVLWHQDLSIALAERHEIEGWGPWSIKADLPHMQPPPAILNEMLTVRLHLVECGPDNGPLRVLPGSHRLGRLRREEITAHRRRVTERVCVAPLGSILQMRPLLLHASSSAKTPSHRRVVHIEYAPRNILPPPLDWTHT